MRHVGWVRLLSGLLLVMGTATAFTQQPPEAKPIAAPSFPDAIDLAVPGLAPDAGPQTEIWVQRGGNAIVRNISRPTLIPFLPDPAKATGAAVIVAPGGAFLALSFDHEGVTVARWLAARGIAAFVLKYRTERVPADPKDFSAIMGQRMTAIAGGRSAPSTLPGEGPAQQDAATAMRLVRNQAKRFGIDPARVGFMGFSAGAKTALNLTLDGQADTRPDFIATIYPPMVARAVPKGAPPMFLAIASDDNLFGGGATGLFDSWRSAGSPAELHIYQDGGHGFGMIPTGKSSQHWIDQFYWWMEARGLLRR